MIIGARTGSFTGMDQKKVFNVVYVKSNHGVGEAKTTTPDCQLVFTGAQVSCSPVGMRPGHADDASRFVRQSQTLKTANGRVVFDGSFGDVSKSVILYDLRGKLVAMKTTKNNVIDLRKELGLKSGVYVVKVRIAQ